MVRPNRVNILKKSEQECWSHAALKLAACRDLYQNPTTLDTIARVNRSILAWPATKDNGEPFESMETVKTTYKKLSSGLNEIKETAESEAKYA